MTDQDDSIQPRETKPTNDAPKDSAFPDWLTSLPKRAQPFVALARLDRPVGIWLLVLPCWMGLFQIRIPTSLAWIDLWWAVLFGIGAVAMRGAGCTWNDIQDREYDAQVERTRRRPLPAGEVSIKEAWIFLAAQLFIGLLVWLCLPLDAKIVAAFAIPLVAIYPFMKRVTWWPQAWLGFTFNFGVLVGAATSGSVTGATVVLYLGLAAWTVAYDTIYALQDVEDDAIIGVRSTARLFGDKVITATFVFHLLATALIAASLMFAGGNRVGALVGLLFLGHGLWQMVRLSQSRRQEALSVFKSNVWAGAIIVAGLILAAAI